MLLRPMVFSQASRSADATALRGAAAPRLIASRSAVPCWRRASNAASSKHHRLDCSTTPKHSIMTELIGARGVSKHSVETMAGLCELRMSFVHRASSLLALQAKPAKRGAGMKSCKQAGSDVPVGHTSPRQLLARGVLISTRLSTHPPHGSQLVRLSSTCMSQ